MRACCRFSAKPSAYHADEMIECELIPEARGLVDFFVRSWIDIPLAECFAVHMEEEIFGFISRDFQQSLPKYGVTKEDMKYFRIHEEADLDEDHGGTNQAILEVALAGRLRQRTRGLAAGILRQDRRADDRQFLRRSVSPLRLSETLVQTVQSLRSSSSPFKTFEFGSDRSCFRKRLERFELLERLERVSEVKMDSPKKSKS